ncbi:MAG: D-2-hydroxyacid dehydrogenase, partial [Chloroflexota bacterium]
MVRVLIASPLEAELVERIRAVDTRLEVVYRADLLAEARFPADHHPPIQRSPAQAAEWAELLAHAEILFDVDAPSYLDFPSRAPQVRWIQASSSGIGEWVRALGIVESPIVVSNAAGIHSVTLAEFVVFSMLYFARNWPRMAAEQRAHHWELCAIETLEGKTLGIVGLG